MTEGKQFVIQQEILVLQIYQEVSFLTEQLLRIFFHLFNFVTQIDVAEGVDFDLRSSDRFIRRNRKISISA